MVRCSIEDLENVNTTGWLTFKKRRKRAYEYAHKCRECGAIIKEKMWSAGGSYYQICPVCFEDYCKKRLGDVKRIERDITIVLEKFSKQKDKLIEQNTLVSI